MAIDKSVFDDPGLEGLVNPEMVKWLLAEQEQEDEAPEPEPEDDCTARLRAAIMAIGADDDEDSTIDPKCPDGLPAGAPSASGLAGINQEATPEVTRYSTPLDGFEGLTEPLCASNLTPKGENAADSTSEGQFSSGPASRPTGKAAGKTATPKRQRGKKIDLAPDAKPAKRQKMGIATANEYVTAAGHSSLSERGTAERAAASCCADVRYCLDTAQYYRYNADPKRPGCWTVDELAGRVAVGRVIETLDAEYSRLLNAFEKKHKWMKDEHHDDILAHYKEYKNALFSGKHIREAERFLREQPGIHVKLVDFDKDLNAINCKNGFVEYVNGAITFQPHDPARLFSKCANVDYDPEATAPLWLDHIEKAMLSNTDDMRFLQMTLGSAVSGEVKERCVYFWYGETGTGKSVILDTVGIVLGTYYTPLPAAAILASHNNDGQQPYQTAARAKLIGKRFVVSDELKGTQLDAEALKAFGSKGEIDARFMGKNWVSFKGTHTYILASNKKPIVDDTGGAVFDRMRVLRFKHQFKQSLSRDDAIDKKIAAEASGVFNWLLQGLVDWHKNGGVFISENVKREVDVYQREMDIAGRFVEDACYVGGEYSCTPGEMFRAFKRRAIENNEWTKMGAGAFHRIMEGAGWFVQQKKIDGKNTGKRYFGICPHTEIGNLTMIQKPAKYREGE